MEETCIQERALVGELIANQLVRHKPANQDAGEEPHYRQEQLTGDEVEEVEQRHTEQAHELSGGAE